MLVAVKDDHAIDSQIPCGPDSSSSGSTDGWVFLGIPVPALSVLALGMPMLGMLWTRRRALGRSRTHLF